MLLSILFSFYVPTYAPAAKCLVMHRSDPTRLQQHALLMCERIDTAVRLMGHMEDGLSRDNLGRGRNPRGQPRTGPQGQGQGQKEGYAQNRLSSSGNSFSRPFPFMVIVFLSRRPLQVFFSDAVCAEAVVDRAARLMSYFASTFRIKPRQQLFTVRFHHRCEESGELRGIPSLVAFNGASRKRRRLHQLCSNNATPCNCMGLLLGE